MYTLLSANPDAFIPFFAIFFTFMVPILIIYFYNQQRKRVMDERRLMIEKGLTPPPMSESIERFRSGRNPLHRGMNMIAIALGLIVAYFVREATDLLMPFCIIGSVLFFLGLSNIFIAIITHKKNNQEHE
jgi:ABC-type polysaccharide/polyol phosphate export permease